MNDLKDLDVFISGEITNLCIPTNDYALKSDWYSLFNDQHITKYLDHGIMPILQRINSFSMKIQEEVED